MVVILLLIFAFGCAIIFQVFWWVNRNEKLKEASFDRRIVWDTYRTYLEAWANKDEKEALAAEMVFRDACSLYNHKYRGYTSKINPDEWILI